MSIYQNIKIAIIHDHLLEDGGAERVLITLSELFPQADIFTSFVSENCETYRLLQKRIIAKKYFHPFFLRLISFFKVFLFSYWEKINLDEYNLVVSLTSSFFSKAVLTSPNTVHICYCLTPPKFLYLHEIESKFFNSFPLSGQILCWLRQKDFVIAQRPDYLIAISEEVKKRITKFYRRDSKIIYPPVHIKDYETVAKKDYYVTVSRLVRPKNLDIAIEACNITQKKLVIIGEGPDKERLKKISGSYITFLGKITDEEKVQIVRHAKGLIFCSEDEDFGISPIEALSLGTPVISHYSGGPKEFITEGVNGVFFFELNSQSLIQAINKYEKTKFNANRCYVSSLKFSEKKFKSNMLKFVDNIDIPITYPTTRNIRGG